ncbi:MAG: hypothetical protein S0880_02335 [Actinomycetota bacterium]|nr:hypothetical protein [Actinomycetota bacterium]
MPNADRHLEIWPVGFRTYNLLVPNLLNLPASLLGVGAPKQLVGLAMYESSRAADCGYCTAHSCSFGLRRGTSGAALAGKYETDVEAAVAQVAEGLGTVPATLTAEDVAELERHLSPAQVEWIALAIATMGFLNMFMDAMGIELEAEAIAVATDIIGPTSWTPGKHRPTDETGAAATDERPETAPAVPKDGLATYLRVLRLAPGAIRLERRWTRGVPRRIDAAQALLRDQVGCSFSTLDRARNPRVVRALTTVLRDNLDADRSVVGLRSKCLAGLVLTERVDNPRLASDVAALTEAVAPDLTDIDRRRIATFALTDQWDERAGTPQLDAGLDDFESAVMVLARAASTSPAIVDDAVIATVTEHLDPAQIVEVLVWLSVLQMLHRLETFHRVRESR